MKSSRGCVLSWGHVLTVWRTYLYEFEVRPLQEVKMDIVDFDKLMNRYGHMAVKVSSDELMRVVSCVQQESEDWTYSLDSILLDIKEYYSS